MQKSSSNPEGAIAVEVVYARAEEQTVIPLEVPAGTTVAQAIVGSGLALKNPELDLSACAVGIYGRLVNGDTLLRDGDRVEIYRPLAADPKQARRRRATRAS